MATFTTTIRDRINAFLADLWTDLSTRQASFYAVRSRYWQGIRCLTVDPADGATVAPDLTLKPYYQPESWADFGLTLPVELEVNLWVDQYIAPSGPGFSATVQVSYNARTWQRSRAFGPESLARTRSWTDVTAPTE